jgi:hypothetical protein
VIIAYDHTWDKPERKRAATLMESFARRFMSVLMQTSTGWNYRAGLRTFFYDLPKPAICPGPR